MAYPVLATKRTWWKPNVSSVTRDSIAEIEITDSYTPDSSVTVKDSWDASAAQDGSITCYVIGTKLIMAGNGSGKIAANADSLLFCYGFPTVKAFVSAHLLDVSNVKNMGGMFMNCNSLTTLDLSSWDVSNVKDMSSMFLNCNSLTTLDLSSWDVSNVTTMEQMFTMEQFNGKLTSLDLSNWNVSNVAAMRQMFMGCISLTSVGNLSRWNVSNVTNMGAIFYGCHLLTFVGDLSSWNVSNATDIDSMFGACESLSTVGDLSNWDISNATNLLSLFQGCNTLSTVGDLSNWNTSKVTGMKHMFNGCSKLTGIGDLANWDVSNVTDMSFMFWGASSIGEIDVSKWNTAKLTNLDHFAAHAGLRRIGMEKWNTSSLTNANAAFHNCAEEELDLSGWDVSKVQFFCQMFENSPNLKRIKGLENWNTSAGLGFDQMFERCYVLEELDLSSFDTSKAKNGVEASSNGHKTATLQNMFLSCNNLRKITLGSNFAVNGNGTNTTAANKLILPTPSTEYLEGADGSWYDFGGMEYAPNAIPDRTANTYHAVYDDVGDVDMIIKNDTLIQIAKAIRTKNGGTDRYQPSEFAAAIEASSGGGSGGETDEQHVLDALIDGSITEVISETAGKVHMYKFFNHDALAKVNMQQVTEIGSNAFNDCNKLVEVNLPRATKIGNNAFYNCTALKKLDLPAATSIGTKTFYNCTVLKSLVLRSAQAATLTNTDAFTLVPNSMYIYVPRALVDTYKTMTNWTTYAARFRALEDYTVDGTITGELDESKI